MAEMEIPASYGAPVQYQRPKQNPLVRLGKAIRNPVNAWFARQSLIGDTPIVDPAALPQLEPLQRNWRTIRAELEQLLKERSEIPSFGEISPDHRRIANTSHWKSFFFEGYGYRSEKNRARCPETTRMLDRLDGLVVAFFSIMEPGTHVPRHRGLTKAWLNCHLPLLVPEGPGRCEMQVGDEMTRWREGKWLLFDETNRHEVWNTTSKPRVVLFLQVRRPMTRRGKLFARAIYEMIRRTSFVRDVKQAIA